jgi:hypothetical protein
MAATASRHPGRTDRRMWVFHKRDGSSSREAEILSAATDTA